MLVVERLRMPSKGSDTGTDAELVDATWLRKMADDEWQRGNSGLTKTRPLGEPSSLSIYKAVVEWSRTILRTSSPEGQRWTSRKQRCTSVHYQRDLWGRFRVCSNAEGSGTRSSTVPGMLLLSIHLCNYVWGRNQLWSMPSLGSRSRDTRSKRRPSKHSDHTQEW